MHSADRYFCESPVMGDKTVLSGPEAHHLIHVMRGGPGTRVVLFDGSGWEYSAQVERVSRTEAAMAILSRQQVDRELPVEIHLGVSLPKGDRQKWLVEKSVELGVGRLIPLKTARSVAQPVEQALSRLRRAVIEASKQCGRNRLLEISEPQDWGDFVSGAPADGLRLLAHPDSGSRASPPSHDRSKDPRPTLHELGGPAAERRPIYAAVGPEGGFTPDEVAQALAAAWQQVDLGRRILRIETAAILLVAMVGQMGGR
jgi:16S rRNA (uracil1498-N3)-methyltransferase